MSKFRNDDLFFDLEIRGNMFVNSQVYPAQKKIIVSFLEDLDEASNGDEDEQKQLKAELLQAKRNAQLHADDSQKNDFNRLFGAQVQNTSTIKEMADETKNAQPLVKTEIVDDNSNQPLEANNRDDHDWKYGILQRYYNNGENDFRVEKLTDRLKLVTQHIKDVAKSVKDFTIEYEDLAIPKDYLKFAKRYGINFDGRVYNQTAKKNQLAPFNVVYDTDDNYDADKYGLRIGYNSVNYDQTMIAHILGDLTNPDSKIDKLSNNNIISNYLKYQETNDKKYETAYHKNFYDRIINEANKGKCFLEPKELANFNTQMFNQEYGMSNALGEPSWFHTDHSTGRTTYDSWNISNRFIDVSAMNPKHISLKRCAMALGYKIQESDTNREPTAPIHSFNGIADLFAYNVNDVYVTWKLLESGSYWNRFQQNQQLLKEFPYMIYEQSEDAKAPDATKKIAYVTGQDHIRTNRLTINDTSTKFVTNAIAPYPNTKIHDKHQLDLVYPDQQIADQLNQVDKLPKLFHGHPRNALDYIEDLLNDLLDEDDIEGLNVTDKTKQRIRDQYQRIKAFYNQYVGKNFNDNLADVQQAKYNELVNDLDVPEIKTNITLLQQFTKKLYKYVLENNPHLTATEIETLKQNILKYFVHNKFINPNTVKPGSKEQKQFLENRTHQLNIIKMVLDPYVKAKDIPEKRLTIQYIRPDGNYVDKHNNGLASYITLSIGGTHGIEIRQQKYQEDVNNYNEKVGLFQNLADYYNQNHLTKAKVTLDNLAEAIVEVNQDKTIKDLKVTPLPMNDNYTYGDIVQSSFSKSRPKLRSFTAPKFFKNNKIDEKYSFTSTDPSNHEDFDSYYPSLISQLAIFRNVDGNDIFTDDLYHPRLKMKKLAKDKSLPESERMKYSLRQLSMKLLVNSASGGGDATFKSNIKCNNKMMAMRIIGQLFCWYIGQTLALFNARIPSTNTDGLYAMNIKQETNDELVEACASRLILKLGPEHLDLFVSKDANNRLESNDGKIDEARGSALTSWQGPSTQNSIDHPAIIDYVLAQYLAHKPDSCNQDFDRDFAKLILVKFLKTNSKLNPTDADTLRYFQFPLDANPKTARYHFLTTLNDSDNPDNITNLNNTNRIFLIKSKDALDLPGEDTVIRMTGLQAVQATSVKNRLNLKSAKDANGTSFRDIIHVDPCADEVIKTNASESFYNKLFNGLYNNKVTKANEKPRDFNILKIKDLNPNQPIMLYNEDLHDASHDEFKDIRHILDLDAYLDIVKDKFIKQWQN